MDFYDEEIRDGKYIQTYKTHADEIIRLDDIVRSLQSKGVVINSIEVAETCELDMKTFGEKHLSPDDFDELRRYDTSYDYHYTIAAEYRGDPVELSVYRSVFSVESDNPDLQFSDIYESETLL